LARDVDLARPLPPPTPRARRHGADDQVNGTAWAKDNIQVERHPAGWIDTALTKRAREQIAACTISVLKRTPAAVGHADDFAASRCSCRGSVRFRDAARHHGRRPATPVLG